MFGDGTAGIDNAFGKLLLPLFLSLANDLPDQLNEEIAERIGSAVRVGGRLALSGILANQVADVKAAFCDRFEFDPPITRDDWALLAGTRN